MDSIVRKIRAHSSATPTRWREEAEYRLENKAWLRYSQMIAARMLDKMELLGMTQKTLAERMGCSQQYISKILRGKENLSLETLSKIEDALELQLVYEPESV
ncbi:MAG: helix-turn-helix transcriptional regulator [Bacteroides sp.]|nr:helix-turn-helix transcriptional regulator [Bacteroides sp.]